MWYIQLGLPYFYWIGDITLNDFNIVVLDNQRSRRAHVKHINHTNQVLHKLIHMVTNCFIGLWPYLSFLSQEVGILT